MIDRSAVRDRVVIVEDDVHIRRAVAATLGLEGYEVSTLGSGKALVAGIRFINRPRVVVLDLTLGDMSGRECLQVIRASRWTDVPVVIFSGWGRLERFGLDAQALISKTDPESLARAVDHLARGTFCRASLRA
jgi:DNA-binding response OmpR family regulator